LCKPINANKLGSYAPTIPSETVLRFGVRQARNQLFISGGSNFCEITFDDIIVIIQPWCNFGVQTIQIKLFLKMIRLQNITFIL